MLVTNRDLGVLCKPYRVVTSGDPNCSQGSSGRNLRGFVGCENPTQIRPNANSGTQPRIRPNQSENQGALMFLVLFMVPFLVVPLLLMFLDFPWSANDVHWFFVFICLPSPFGCFGSMPTGERWETSRARRKRAAAPCVVGWKRGGGNVCLPTPCSRCIGCHQSDGGLGLAPHLVPHNCRLRA